MQIPANCAGLSRVKVYYRLSSPITLPKILRGARGAAPLAVGDAERGAILGLSACRVRGSASIVQRHRDAETDDRINLGTVAGEDLTEKIPDTHLQPAKRDHIAQVDREPASVDRIERQPDDGVDAEVFAAHQRPAQKPRYRDPVVAVPSGPISDSMW